jgi:hypothetical protein
VRTTGHGLLIEFPSVVEAARYSVGEETGRSAGLARLLSFALSSRRDPASGNVAQSLRAASNKASTSVRR